MREEGKNEKKEERGKFKEGGKGGEREEKKSERVMVREERGK